MQSEIPQTFKLTREERKILSELSRTLGLPTSTIIHIAISNLIKDLIENEEINEELKLEALRYQREEYVKKERKCLEAFKSYLRSHGYGYLIRNIETMVDRERKRLERYKRLIKNEEIRKALENFLNERHYYAQKIGEVEEKISEILRKRMKWKTINELLQETEKIIENS